MPSILETKSLKLTAKTKHSSKKNILRTVVLKTSKPDILKKPFAYLIGCIEGAPDLSKRKGYSPNWKQLQIRDFSWRSQTDAISITIGQWIYLPNYKRRCSQAKLFYRKLHFICNRVEQRCSWSRVDLCGSPSIPSASGPSCCDWQSNLMISARTWRTCAWSGSVKSIPFTKF